jgi:hypothetical protein
MLLKLFIFQELDAKLSLSLSVTYSASTEERPKEAVCSTESDLLRGFFFPLKN